MLALQQTVKYIFFLIQHQYIYQYSLIGWLDDLKIMLGYLHNIVLQVVITGSGDCMIRLYNLNNFECFATLTGHSFAVLKVHMYIIKSYISRIIYYISSFYKLLQVLAINSGKQLLSSDSGGLMKIWDVAEKECIKTIEAHDDKIWALLTSKDENQFITGFFS